MIGNAMNARNPIVGNATMRSPSMLSRLPKGFSVRYLEQRQEYVLLKGRKIVAEGMKDKQEAVETAKKMGYDGTLVLN